MARKRGISAELDTPTKAPSIAAELQRPPAELLFADELRRLTEADAGKPRPQGWKLTPQAIVQFVLGDDALGIAPKFVGKRSFIERCVVALATNRGLMLIGEPGTAKSWLSELLAAAICGNSTLTIQGSAGTTEDAIKYSWNYALLLAEGPSERSLVPAPLYRGMQEGQMVRFEELTRCPLEMQDILLSILSDRVLAVPELHGEARSLFAKTGFNVIATANTRDRGVNEMSAALKRRFNFETVHPIADLREEMELVQRETDKLLGRAGIPQRIPPEMTEVLVTTFHELRSGQSQDGNALETLTTAMSTAEAISTGVAAAMHAWYYADGSFHAEHLVQHLLGTALKDAPDDLKKLRHYFNHVAKGRSGRAWQAFYDAQERAAVNLDPLKWDGFENRPTPTDALADLSAPIIFFPVRHHSPTAARLVRQLIETRRPQAVLIEGPSDFNERFDELYLPHRLPIAVYSYVRYAGFGRRGAYHPFCEHSPEWQALLAAKECGAKASFIDLPFAALAKADEEPTNRYADADMQRSKYTALLCRKLGVEDFNAVWDTLFELDAAMSVETYLQRCHSLCGNMRLLEGPGSVSDRRREAFMAAMIRRAQQENAGQIVVVTGGFHSLALYTRAACGLAEATAKPQAANPLCNPLDFSPPAPEPGEERGIALTPYSFERLDSLTGYNAGMPNPGFYQQLWRDQRKHADTHRILLKQVAAQLREANQRVSAADLIAVETTARGLAAVRGHSQVWRTDLVDALTSSLIKEELSKSGSHPILDAVHDVLRGGERGLLAAGTVLPPLVHDIRKELADHDLEPRPQARELRLELEEADQRVRSRVLHRLRPLDTGGHERIAGTDLATRDDLGRVWEQWRIVWNPDFDAHCIEAARYGPTLADAATSRLTELAGQIERDAARAALLLLDAAQAGLTELAGPLLARLRELIRGDGDYFSVSASLGHLLYLYRYDAVLETAGHGEIGALLVETFERGLWLFESLGQVTGRDADLLRGLQSLRETFERCGVPLGLNRDAFLEVLARVGADRHQLPLVRGAALGARWSLGAADSEQVQTALRLFADPNQLGDFLTGLFALAREQVQRQRDLVLSIHSLLGCYSDEDFLVALPALRLAFTYFTPREKHHLALTLREGLGLTKEPELAALTVSVETAARALAFETRLFEALEKYGIRGVEPGEPAA